MVSLKYGLLKALKAWSAAILTQMFLGGGFILGDSVLYGPNRLLSKDVILVTVHYRLGALGKQI
jgi:hypothetical protein